MRKKESYYPHLHVTPKSVAPAAERNKQFQ
jgi:hypothetical protein